MTVRAAAQRWAALFAAVLLAGCATLNGSPASQPFAEVIADSTRLKELAEAQAADQNFELAYRYLALIHILHPQSAENREVFPLAAAFYRKSWAPHRTELDSVWTTSEPVFMFGWLAGFFVDAQEFPQGQVEALFLNMNYGLLRDFIAYGRSRPYVALWTISADKDNGIVQKISGSRS
jgi:hypothetical protein